MSETMLPDNGKTPGYYASIDLRVTANEDRLDEHEGRFNAIMRELRDISETMGKTYHAASAAANEATAVRGELREERLRQQRECDIRHEGVSARLTLAERPDEFDDKSGVTYAPDVLAIRYDERGVKLIEAQAQARKMTITAIATGVATVLAAAAAAWQLIGG